MKKATDISRFSFSRFLGRLLVFFPLFLFLFFLAGPLISRGFIPVMETEMRIIRPHYDIALSYGEPARIAYKIAIPFVWRDEAGKRQEGIVKEGRLPASNVAIHPILVLSALLAWPTVPWKKREPLSSCRSPSFSPPNFSTFPFTSCGRWKTGFLSRHCQRVSSSSGDTS